MPKAKIAGSAKALATRSPKAAAKRPAKASPKPAPGGKPSAKPPATRMTLKGVMAALEEAGTAQARRTYTRHGASEPMFGVSFGDLKKMLNRIKIDQELAEALWDTGNFDARNLAAKVCDPANFPPKVLDAWASVPIGWLWGGYVGQIAAEGRHGKAKAEKWLAAKNDATRTAGWCAVGAMAMIDEATPDSWFADRLAEIEKGMKAASSRHKYVMNNALIAIGCRGVALRKAATAAAKRLGTIEVDMGDTDCKTPDAVERLEKTWDRAKASGYESPAAQERDRESMRTRC
ncbi:MAG: DNA alkylation repair protein [Phycisphaerales bacterium]|nr:DNA alkylation repair protein [Phycisphaerales bacterium]